MKQNFYLSSNLVSLGFLVFLVSLLSLGFLVFLVIPRDLRDHPARPVRPVLCKIKKLSSALLFKRKRRITKVKHEECCASRRLMKQQKWQSPFCSIQLSLDLVNGVCCCYFICHYAVSTRWSCSKISGKNDEHLKNIGVL